MNFDETVNSLLLHELFNSTYNCSYPYVFLRDKTLNHFKNFDELMSYCAEHVNEVEKVAVDFKNVAGNNIQFSLHRDYKNVFESLDGNALTLVFDDTGDGGTFRMTKSGDSVQVVSTVFNILADFLASLKKNVDLFGIAWSDFAGIAYNAKLSQGMNLKAAKLTPRITGELDKGTTRRGNVYEAAYKKIIHPAFPELKLKRGNDIGDYIITIK